MPQLRERLQKQHPHLTSDDLLFEGEEELLKRLEKKVAFEGINNWGLSPSFALIGISSNYS